MTEVTLYPLIPYPKFLCKMAYNRPNGVAAFFTYKLNIFFGWLEFPPSEALKRRLPVRERWKAPIIVYGLGGGLIVPVYWKCGVQ